MQYEWKMLEEQRVRELVCDHKQRCKDEANECIPQEQRLKQVTVQRNANISAGHQGYESVKQI